MIPTSTPEIAPETITIRVSRYWPPLGGVNCWRFINGECVSRTRSGERWQDWAEGGAACPYSWLMKAEVYARDQWWKCVDTGGKIVYGADGIPWVDFLTETPLAPYGSTMEVGIRWLEEH